VRHKNLNTIATNQGRPALLAIALFLGGLTYAAFDGSWKDFWISHDGKRITATIVAEGQHGVRDYEYLVNGTQYIGHGQIGRDFDRKATIGGESFVYFSTSHPWLSAPQTSEVYSPWRSFAIIGLLLLGDVFIVTELLKTRNRAQAKPAN
jgi:hypothetical protein